MTDPNVNSNEESAGTSHSLIEKVQGKDQSAWDRLVALYTPLVRNWCRHWKLQQSDTADVVQEVFLSVARNIETFEWQRSTGSFRAWMRSIAYHKACDLWKRRDPVSEGTVGGSDALRRLHELPSQPPPPPENSDEAAQEDHGILYRRAVDLVLTDFEERTAKAFWQVVLEGRSPAVVAAELGLTPNAVYLAKARVLARLRQEFKGLIDE